MAKAVSPYKGKLVHIRKTWGHAAGQVDEDSLYKVTSCGPKMAILRRIDKVTLEPLGWRGQSYYLTSREEVEALRIREASSQMFTRSFRYWDWSQFFVPVGEAGWDPDENW